MKKLSKFLFVLKGLCPLGPYAGFATSHSTSILKIFENILIVILIEIFNHILFITNTELFTTLKEINTNE